MARTSSECFVTPASRKSVAPMCPLKRLLNDEDDQEEESPPPLERECGGDLAPRQLDMDQHVSFGSAEEDKYVEKGDENEEEEEEPATQVYVPPDEDATEEGELVQPTPPAAESDAPVVAG